MTCVRTVYLSSSCGWLTARADADAALRCVSGRCAATLQKQQHQAQRRGPLDNIMTTRTTYITVYFM